MLFALTKAPAPAIWKLPGWVPRSTLPAHWPLEIFHSSVSPVLGSYHKDPVGAVAGEICHGDNLDPASGGTQQWLINNGGTKECRSGRARSCARLRNCPSTAVRIAIRKCRPDMHQHHLRRQNQPRNPHACSIQIKPRG